ncbi:MAG: ABC transporter ATP-binding protein [Planctomycetota bacterium]|nr:ABC transporter ATP-binding protein [Planctomycetota bacterium]
MHPPLQVISAVKRFRQGSNVIRALDGVSLEVSAGEFVAIMGASGSGKSTLLHAMAGLTGLDSGRVIVEGQDLAALSDSKLTAFRRRRIGLVFQAFNLIPTLSAEDNIRLPAIGSNGLDSRVEGLLDLFGLRDRRSHRPDALSGGEQQRVAIARALINEPAILLADEPTGSLDSAAGQDLCRLFRRLCTEKRCTITIVTHEAAVAMWADRVVVLKDGVNRAEFRPSGTRDPQEISIGYQKALQAAEATEAKG